MAWRTWALVAMLAAAGLAVAQAAARTVGTVRAAGLVDASRDGVAWEPIVGGPLAEGYTLRTGLGGSATLQLPGGDVLGLGEGTDVQATTAAPPSFVLGTGRLVLILGPGSVTAVSTPGGIVRLPLGSTPTGPGASASIFAADGQTSIAVRDGEIDVLQGGGTVIALGRGQEATVSAGTPGAVVTSTAGGPDDPDAPHPPGNPRSDPRIMTSPLVAQFWVAIAVIGGGFLACVGML